MDKDFSKYCKPSSREFWQNIWFYYRVHIIVGIIAAILIGVTIKEIIDRKGPDCAVLYMGTMPLSSDPEPEEFLKALAKDVNDDGAVTPQVLNIGLGIGDDPQYTSALIQKADVSFVAEEAPYIILMEEECVERYINMEVFAPIDSYAKKYDIDATRLLDGVNKKPVCVDITGSAFAEKIGYAGGKKLYAGIQFERENKKDDEEYVRLYTEASRLFEMILEDKLQ